MQFLEESQWPLTQKNCTRLTHGIIWPRFGTLGAKRSPIFRVPQLNLDFIDRFQARFCYGFWPFWGGGKENFFFNSLTHSLTQLVYTRRFDLTSKVYRILYFIAENRAKGFEKSTTYRGCVRILHAHTHTTRVHGRNAHSNAVDQLFWGRIQRDFLFRKLRRARKFARQRISGKAARCEP